MAKHLVDLATVLMMWAALAAACYGWGRAGAAALGLDLTALSGPYPVVWLGWAISVFLLQLVHLVFALDVRVSVAVYGAGIALAVASYLRHPRAVGGGPGLSGGLWAAGLMLVAAWIAARAMLPPTVPDSGAYHFNTIRWYNAYPIVPGLGNLHGRLAFNQSFFAYAASLNFFPYFPHGRAVANGFLVLLLLSDVLWQLRTQGRRWRQALADHPFRSLPALFIAPILAHLCLTTAGLASPTPDLASTIVQLYLFMSLVGLVADARTGTWRDARVAIPIVVATTAITLKLSNLAFSTAVIAVCVVCWASSTRDRAAAARNAMRVGLVCAIILVVWVARGYILSGYPLYPATVAALPLDWAVPAAQAQRVRDVIYGWARMPRAGSTEVLGRWDWLGPWARRLVQRDGRVGYTGVVAPTVAAGIALALTVAVGVAARRRHRSPPRMADALLLVPVFAGLAFWFFTAPVPRFAHALFWLFPVASALLLLSWLQPSVGARGFVVAAGAALVALNAGFLTHAIMNIHTLTAVSTTGFHAIPAVPLSEVRTRSGAAVYTPAEGQRRCWDSPLPCAPRVNARLELRTPGRLQSGFRLGPPS